MDARAIVPVHSITLPSAGEARDKIETLRAKLASLWGRTRSLNTAGNANIQYTVTTKLLDGGCLLLERELATYPIGAGGTEPRLQLLMLARASKEDLDTAYNRLADIRERRRAQQAANASVTGQYPIAQVVPQEAEEERELLVFIDRFYQDARGWAYDAIDLSLGTVNRLEQANVPGHNGGTYDGAGSTEAERGSDI